MERQLVVENKLELTSQRFYYEQLYKCRGASKMSQEERRRDYLEKIRLRRLAQTNQHRNLVEDIIEDSEMDITEMEVETKGKKKKKIIKCPYQLMQSEWLTEIPFDLGEKWLVKLCPIGKRRLVMARNQRTWAFNKHGMLKDRFYSCLPGGSKRNGKNMTLIDCIYNFKLRCYFVLDVLIWNNHLVRDSETDFRFFFLKSRLNDNLELGEIRPYNQRRFFDIDYFPALPDLIEEKIEAKQVIDDEVVLTDGLLFFHIETSYVSGSTPLVGWLKPNMLPAKFQISVPDLYLHQEKTMDTNPCNTDLHIEEFGKMDIV